jgi:hypothetical protein
MCSEENATEAPPPIRPRSKPRKGIRARRRRTQGYWKPKL